MIIGFTIPLGSRFLSGENFGNMFSSQTVALILAIAVLLPLTAGDFDLSVASVLTLSALITATLNVNHGWSIWTACLAALGACLAVGLVNAMFIAFIGIDSFIVTLGTSTVLTGLSLRISDSTSITGVSQTLSDLVVGDRFLGVSLEFYYGLILVAIMWYVFECTPAGRRLLFVGRSRSVARLSGIKVRRARMLALMGCSLIAGLAGIVFAGTTGGADPSSGATFLLPAFAAAFLGSTAIKPGRFNAVGTLIAVYFLVTGITGLGQLGVDAYVQQLCYGGALLVAVTVSHFVRGRRAAAAA
jgi:ribose transport system permease protein